MTAINCLAITLSRLYFEEGNVKNTAARNKGRRIELDFLRREVTGDGLREAGKIPVFFKN